MESNPSGLTSDLNENRDNKNEYWIHQQFALASIYANHLRPLPTTALRTEYIESGVRYFALSPLVYCIIKWIYYARS